jgi:hypothetical protein
MKRLLLISFSSVLLYSCLTTRNGGNEKDREKEKDGYDNAFLRETQQANNIKDPALGYVPYQRLYTALTERERSIQESIVPNSPGSVTGLNWIERGPIFDSVGPSNGNTRGGPNTIGGHTSGRIRAFLLDTLNDPSGNTAFVAGIAGGLWKCTDFLATFPSWAPVNDYFSNLAIGSICQDPTNRQIMYFSTGEAASNADAVYGKGIWKSTNGGNTFTFLPSSANFLRTFKIGCDAAGNVYIATRITTVPVAQSKGMFRSTDGGASWVDITPDNLTSVNTTCTDFEITSSGKLNAMFGYATGVSTATVNHRYTPNPATVTASTWLSSTGFRPTNTPAMRTKLACKGDILYAVTINTSYNSDSCYKSIDGGVTWTKQNTIVLPTGLGSGQGWYNISLAINPANTDEIISGGLDAYRSINGGATWVKFTNWVSTSPYVHADHHYAAYWIVGAETRIIMCTDGGIFYSNNNGTTFSAKNKNLGIKQFYSAAIHPAAGSDYLLAGAQDNGTHQLKNPGLSYSIEVTGGDGCIVHINQQNPLIQFGSYVYNQYRRSVNGGISWSSVNLSGSQGLFVNPFDYDDGQNIMYASNGGLGQIRRWPNANTANTSTAINISTIGSTTSITSLKVSPYTPNRVFFGTNTGKVYKLDNASTVVDADANTNTTLISSTAFGAGTIMCVNTGTNDNNIVAVYSNYGVNNVWVTSDGGTTWSAIDGNLPDMPVRWALYHPGSNNKIYIATEAGIYVTDQVNGASTVWIPESTFPAVRTDMLKMRSSDSTFVAGTHGRGLWTAKISSCLISSILTQPTAASFCAGNTASFSSSVTGSVTSYQWQVSTNNGTTYTDIAGANASVLNIPNITTGMDNNLYRLVANTSCSGILTSSAAKLTVNNPITITTQPANPIACVLNGTSITVLATGTTPTYQWQVSTDGGITFTNITNGGNYNGATTATLVISNTSFAMNGFQYRVVINGAAGCSSVTSLVRTLSVKPSPVAVLTLASNANINPYVRTGLYVTVSPLGTYSYQWFKNNIAIPSITTSGWDVSVDDFGEYYATVTDLVTGCIATTNKLTVRDSVSTTLFVTPNPSSGVFTVRYHSANNSNVIRTLNVYDAKGARVYSKVYNISNTYQAMPVNMKNAAAGVYMIELKDEKGSPIATGKVVIKR